MAGGKFHLFAIVVMSNISCIFSGFESSWNSILHVLRSIDISDGAQFFTFEYEVFFVFCFPFA